MTLVAGEQSATVVVRARKRVGITALEAWQEFTRSTARLPGPR
ncbi:hypothetical protein [Streptomyces collinus]